MNVLNIKILVAHRELRGVVKNSILCPIQTGCARATALLPDMLRDNEGENISKDNPRYCELSAHYWAWKNQDKLGNPHYIGLMHNRRHFMFDTELPIPSADATWLPNSHFYIFPPITDNYLKHLSEEKIAAYFPQYDCMVIKGYNEPEVPFGKRITKSFGLENPEIFDVFANVLREKYPSYSSELNEFWQGDKQYLCNMFVMNKELFEEYSSFLFGVLAEVDSRIDSSAFTGAKLRFLGYLGEYLLTIFVMKLQKNPSVKIIEMNGAYFEEKYNPADKKKLWRYALMSLLFWGEKRKIYRQKYALLKAKIKVLQNFKY
ncbi:MAG: DUF4422 domain-containing protein [Elusimicrobium sp.]|uniref:DUF4422 domain-containing protein n=1 Tax=Candidatus Avelusimicrobium gallicola TaxID=2562704 RepID=A0A928HE89_9BACT|nr:DUF4422 domain-containing protein [Elusimicrobium sp.]